jgi:hypothetical protein
VRSPKWIACPSGTPAGAPAGGVPKGTAASIPVAKTIKPADTRNSIVIDPTGPQIRCGQSQLTTYRNVVYSKPTTNGKKTALELDIQVPKTAGSKPLVVYITDDMIDTVASLAKQAVAEPDAWHGLTASLEKVCELQAFDRGLREVMLGTGRGPQRQSQVRERAAPAVDLLVARAKEQGMLRSDAVGIGSHGHLLEAVGEAEALGNHASVRTHAHHGGPRRVLGGRPPAEPDAIDGFASCQRAGTWPGVPAA